MDTHTPTPAERILRNTILYALGFVVIAILGRFGLAFLAFIPAVIFTVTGPGYVLTVFVLTLGKRQKERELLDTMDEDGKQQLTQHVAYKFEARSQIHTFANNILLTFSTIGGIILAIVITATKNSEDIQDVILWALGTALVVQTIITIIFNTGIVYNQKLRLAEQHALRTRTGAWKLILINRVWSWGIWTVGALMGIGLMVLFGVTGGI
jgi:hypothetical protein